jgi:aspartyl-tRNA(Asn)/glutamyl-tRNA(Gln) amidotransferase subunit C
MSIDITEVRRVAQLARLRLDEAELATMQQQLSRILEHIALLHEVDVRGVPSTAQVTDLANALRPDQVRPSLPVAAALQNAQDTQEGLFRVPAVFDE